jgi:hypothetical protein
MDREVAKLIRETRRKEKQDKQVKKVITIMTMTEWVVERELTRQQ